MEIILNGKKYYCNICGEKSCEFIAYETEKIPLGCPFDDKFKAEWKPKKE